MFTTKKHLEKQMMKKERDGSLIVTDFVNIYEDVEILEPDSYRDKFKKGMLL